MKTLHTCLFAACLALAGGAASAQTTTQADTKADTKNAMAAENCKDHVNTMKGQKRSDPPTADTADKCAGTSSADHSTKMKKGMKNHAGTTQEQPAAPSK